MIPDIRKATLADVPNIAEIYNEAVLNTTATFDIEPKTSHEMRKWFKAHGPKNPIVVAVIDSKVVGWASLSEWSTRCAYADTAELSVYVKDTFRNRGLGKKLIQSVLAEGKKAGLHTVISRIAGDNDVSIHIHSQFGFENIGVMKEVGKKFGKLLDVHMLQKIY
jgi:phosphinothricin acetyltransferase